MEANETWCWKFTQKPTDASEVRCPECDTFYPLTNWARGDSDAYCETCGNHSAMICPNPQCEHQVDQIFQEGKLEVRQPDEVK